MIKDSDITQMGDEFTMITEAATEVNFKLWNHEKKCKLKKNPDRVKILMNFHVIKDLN
jgi:hypothetical protein